MDSFLTCPERPHRRENSVHHMQLLCPSQFKVNACPTHEDLSSFGFYIVDFMMPFTLDVTPTVKNLFLIDIIVTLPSGYL